ncbi:hypothetical protein V0R37_15100 [Pollutimonas sp. H1-120]|uniref:hypothetical protein n=1 Tax=Pollutimonas sp. H1-120 TaxID=3148824 RepID=UPI003B52A326
MKKYDIKSLDEATQERCKAARRVCLYGYMAYTVGILSFIPGGICALIIGFNYLNQQSLRRFHQDPEFAMGFTFFACVAVLPLACYVIYRKMKPKMEAAIEFLEGLAEKEDRSRKVADDVLYLEELELAKRNSTILAQNAK